MGDRRHPGHEELPMPAIDAASPSSPAGGDRGLRPDREPVDALERRAVRERLDRCLCVEAAAGTGKTTLLVDRIVGLLACGVRPSHIAAITFTEMAAAELKQRLRARLEAEDPERALELEAAQVSTIHSLALTILRERPIEAGLHPGFETLDPARSEELFDELWREWLKAEVPEATDPGTRRGAVLLRLALAVGLDTGALRDAAWRLYEHRDVVLQARKGVTAVPAGELAGALKAFEERLRRELAGSGGALDTEGVRPDDRMAQAIRRLRDQLEEISGDGGLDVPGSEAEYPQGLAALAEVWRRSRVWLEAFGTTRAPGSVGAQANWPSRQRLEQARRLFGELQGELAGLVARAGRLAAEALASWLCEFIAWAQEEKKRRGCIDFLDQLLLCRDLLRDFPAVRRQFQLRWQRVLVDEFQDTDPLQAEIAFFLAEQPSGGSGEQVPPEGEAAGGLLPAACGRQADRAGGTACRHIPTGPAADWETVQLGPGRLFVVGDPKQSIYRFRRADVEIYEKAARRLEALGERLTIRQNFRSCPAIARWVNLVFARLMAAPAERDAGGDGDGQPQGAGDGAGQAYQPHYVPIEPWRADPGREGWPSGAIAPGVYRLEPLELDPGAGAAERRQEEARWLAAAIRELVEGQRLRVWDEGSGAFRPAGFGDVAVLMPAFTDLDVYEEALRESGVPFRVAGGRQFYVRSEVRELCALLSAVVDPTDTMAVVAALRSGFFGVGDDQLLRWVQAGRSFDPLAVEAQTRATNAPGAADAAGAAGDGSPGVVGIALGEIRRWHYELIGAPPHRAVRRLLDETGYRAFTAAGPGGERALANLAKVEAYAAAHEAEGASLHAFVRWLRRRGPGGPAAAEEEDAPLAEAGDDAVRVMTVHKAKGLEFPVVFVVNLFGERPWSEPVVVDRRTGRVEIRLGRRELGLMTQGFEDAAAAEKARSQAERVRVYYVAMTRARDYLVVGTAGGEQGFWGQVARLGLGEQATPPPLPVSVAGGTRPGRPEATAASEPAGTPPGRPAGATDAEPAGVAPGQPDGAAVRPGPEGHEVAGEGADATEAGGGFSGSLAEFREQWLRSRATLLARASCGLRVEAAREGPGGGEGRAGAPPGLGESGGVQAGIGERQQAGPGAPGWDEGVDAPADAAHADGTRIGQAFHMVMERAAQRRLAVDEGWTRRQVDAVAWVLGLDADEADRVRRWVAAACEPSSELRRWAQRAEGCWVEVPLAYAEEGGERIREGRIDLLCREAGGLLRAVDYKTDDASPETLAHRYRPQAEAYAEGLARALSRRAHASDPDGGGVEVYLYCARHGALVLAARRTRGAAGAELPSAPRAAKAGGPEGMMPEA